MSQYTRKYDPVQEWYDRAHRNLIAYGCVNPQAQRILRDLERQAQLHQLPRRRFLVRRVKAVLGAGSLRRAR